MRSKAWLIVAGILGLVVLLTGACSLGFVAARTLTHAQTNLPVQAPLELPTVASASTETAPVIQGSTPEELAKLFAPFWQAWDLVHKQYVDQPVDDEALMRGAIKGMMEALGDEHTAYLNPDVSQRLTAELQGEEYEGIGAWVDTGKEFLTIISPMPGSPAEKAGLLPGDQIISVDGVDMTGIDGELVRQKVIGPPGSTVRLTIHREGTAEPFDVEVVRASITVPSIEGKMLEDNIAYVRLFIFGDSTAQDLHNMLKDLMAKKPDGLVLDLRNNGGGYLDTATQVASEFIGDGVIMYEEYGDGSRTTYEARRGGLVTQIPVVVLINEGSASASEIVAGAIQDRQRGKLVGVTSFGKGSVQTIEELINNEGEVRVTIARWLTPGGRTIHKKGLTPDVEVKITEDDLKANRDPQLDKAVELLKK